jgi:photosystem II stability/assembly factor-like uncharacterized protein
MPPEYRDVTYLDVFFLKSNPQFGWICGYEGKTLRTTNGGKTWLGSRLFNRFGAPQEAQLESITFLNENVGYTSGPKLNENGDGLIYKSTDGGATWFDVTPNNVSDLWGNYFIDENFGVVIGGGCGSSQYFWRTTNGGTSWESLIYNQPDSKMADAIIYSKDGLGYAIGSGWLWKTGNGGSTWLPIHSTGKADWHEELTNIDQTFLIPYSDGCFGNTVTNVGGVKFSQDEGRTWLQYSTGVPMFGTFLIDKNRGWAAGFNRTIVYTYDGGKNWTSNNCGIKPGDNLDDIYFINDTTAWVVGNGVYEFFIPNATAPVITVSKGNPDFKICEGDTITLTANDGYDAYIWSTGQSGKQIKVFKTGQYSVRGIIDSICYDGMSQWVDVKYFDKYQPVFKLSSGGMPCEGDTVIVEIENNFLDYEWFDGSKDKIIEVTKESDVSVVLTDTNGCKLSGSIKITFSPKPKPKIKSYGRLNFCIGDSVDLSTTEQYTDYKWYEVNNNVSISSQKTITVTQSGEFYVVVNNANGCDGISDTVQVTVKNEKNALDFLFSANENILDLDSAYFSMLNCKMLKILNKSDKDISLDDVYILRNIAFSSPQSQFPVIIKANSEASVKICFSPDRFGQNIDTLLLSDICSDHFIKLLGMGITEEFIDNSKCDVPLKFEMTNLKNSVVTFGLGQIYPNPATSKISVNFSASTDDFSDLTNNIKLWVMNSIGSVSKVQHTIFINPVSEKLLNGEIIIDTSELLPGLYVVAFDIYGKVISGNFTVVR